MEDKEKRELLKAEYLHLQTTIEGFDSKALTIKAWSVTFGFAAFGVSYSSKTPAILLVATLASIVFWLLEALWKIFQLAYYERIYAIERFFANQEQDIIPLQICSVWPDGYRSRLRTLHRVIFWPHVLLPHIVVALIGLLLYHYSPVSSAINIDLAGDREHVPKSR